MSANDDCRLLNSKQLRHLLGNCSAMLLWRYEHDENYRDINFPRSIQIAGRNFWRAREIVDWIDERAAQEPVKRKRPGGKTAA